jgi:hypothetical protein
VGLADRLGGLFPQGARSRCITWSSARSVWTGRKVPSPTSRVTQGLPDSPGLQTLQQGGGEVQSRVGGCGGHLPVCSGVDRLVPLRRGYAPGDVRRQGDFSQAAEKPCRVGFLGTRRLEVHPPGAPPPGPPSRPPTEGGSGGPDARGGPRRPEIRSRIQGPEHQDLHAAGGGLAGPKPGRTHRVSFSTTGLPPEGIPPGRGRSGGLRPLVLAPGQQSRGIRGSRGSWAISSPAGRTGRPKRRPSTAAVV